MRFAYALQKHFKRVNTFLFSTGVVEVSDLLRARNLPKRSAASRSGAAGVVRRHKHRRFAAGIQPRHGPEVLSRDTIFMILSDGWDTGAPDMLAAELRST